MPGCRLIALDLDGTLLNYNKELTDETAAVLEKAAAAGIEIVPCSGRYYKGMPEKLRALPFIHYAITMNGAEVLDTAKKESIIRAEIPLPLAERIFDYLDTLPTAYDCFLDGWGHMPKEFFEIIEEFIPSPPYLRMIKELRAPAEHFRDFVRKKAAEGKNVQKIQFYAHSSEERDRIKEALQEKFPETVLTCSESTNAEINIAAATKGAALKALAERLGIDISETMAFGDSLNDVSMLKAAGRGVAMENASDEVKAAADLIAPHHDKEGAAQGILRWAL